MPAKPSLRLDALESRLSPPEPDDDGAAVAESIEQIAERLRASPDWREPTEAEIAAGAAEFEAMVATL